MMSGHPGCSLDDMVLLAKELQRAGLKVEQVQEFTPTPGTASSCMYYTGFDPASGEPVFVARSDREKILQKSVLLWHLQDERQRALKMLGDMGRQDLVQLLNSGPAVRTNGTCAPASRHKKTTR
jgi:radical SAM superfamily enzyme YgiQ (UPF0313 family)